MFGFFGMAGNYDDRKVDRYKEDGLTISTARVTDSDWDYETAVSHLSYNNGDWIIVEGYDDLEKAEKEHKAWVEKMTADDLPESLTDISTASVVKFGLELGMDVRETHEKKEESLTTPSK